MKFHRIPPILMLTLQRFKGGKKNEDLIKFPMKGLDMSQYMQDSTDSSNGTSNDDKYTYDLFAVINHIGRLYAGHYTAQCFNEEADLWYDFNDSTITAIKVPEGESK